MARVFPMRACFALACLFSTLASAAPVPKEIAKKPTSLAGTWKIVESQRFGAKPNTNEAYWTMDEKGNSWFHQGEKPPLNAKPTDVNVADVATGEMKYRSPDAKNGEYSMYGVFAFVEDVLIINYHFEKSGPEKRPKSVELEAGGMRWKLKKVADFNR
jgi:hypothetical protein